MSDARDRDKTIAVLGATGRQGGAVARHLLRDGWRVRAMTRTPHSAKAKALVGLGADVARGDMADRASMDAALGGAHGVYSVQNPMLGGHEAEVRQGKTVADAAAAGVRHLVYGSAGPGRPGTSVPSWESKLQ